MMVRQWFLMSLVLLVVASLLLAGCNPMGESAAQAAPPRVEAATSVEVADVTSGNIAVVYSYSGDLKSQSSVNLLPGAAGRVEAVEVEVGETVQSGDPIVIVESDIYRVQLEQAQASLDVARLQIKKMDEGTRAEQIIAAEAAVKYARDSVKDMNEISDDERTAAVAALAQAESALKLAQSEYDKIGWAGQVGMTPQALQLEQATIAYEAAQAAYDLQVNPSDLQLSPLLTQLAQAEMALALAKEPFTQTDYEMARGQVKLAEAAVEMAEIQMDETVIRAPFDGVVAELYIHEGDMAGPSSPVALVVSDAVEVEINVEENRITQMQDGLYAAIQVSAYPGQDFPAVVTSVAPIADSTSHTFLITVTPLDDEHLLRSGMYADVSIMIEEKQDTVLVPRSAVTLVNNQDTVYVVNGEVAQQRSVDKGLADSENVEILEGLEVGESVVIAGQANLVDGAKVNVHNSSPES